MTNYVLNYENYELEIAADNLIQKLGVPAHLKGFRYLRTAIRFAVEDEEVLDGMMKRLYPMVAEIHKTTASRVERSIRNAIDSAWVRGRESEMQLLVNNNCGKPTNSEIIAYASNKIRLRFLVDVYNE